jgi:predicted ATPase
LSKHRFHVITGASGAGKSTLLAALGEFGYSVIPEAALAIVQEQQERKGSILPWVHRPAFMEELLARNIRNHQAAQSLKAPVFFDRGIPECLAWFRLSGMEVNPTHLMALDEYRYADPVFVAEPWREIYVENDERRAGFERATRSFEPTVAAYVDAGYRTCILPKVSVEERVAFVLERISQ